MSYEGGATYMERKKTYNQFWGMVILSTSAAFIEINQKLFVLEPWH